MRLLRRKRPAAPPPPRPPVPPPSSPLPSPPPSPPPLGLVLDGVAVVSAEGRPVLQDLSVHLKEARVGLIGANGAGKSTLARLFNGLARPSRGRVLVDGLDVARDTRAVRRKVGFLFQSPEAQIVMPTAGEDVAFGLAPLRLGKAETTARVAAALAGVGLAGFEERPAHALSGGEKQRLALASVLALEPDILIMDEPTTQLDLAGRRLFARLVAGLRQRVVLATHDLELLDAFDRVLVVDQGRLVADAPPAEARAFYEALILAREAAR